MPRKLLAYTHTKGDWETQLPNTIVEFEQRNHYVTFVIDKIVISDFDILRTVNVEEFLDCPPGMLCCNSVRVSKVTPANETEAEAIIQESQQILWELAFVFIEKSGQDWNHVITPNEDGTFSRRPIPLGQPFDMHAFVDLIEDRS